jgi:hypothetical protein
MSTDPAPTTATGADADRSLGLDRHYDVRQPERVQPPQRRHIGSIVVGSLAVGLLTAVALRRRPVRPVQDECAHRRGVAGLRLWVGLAGGCCPCGFSDQPQRWAAAPAEFLALASLISLLPPGSVAQEVFGRIWPPLLPGLVVWVILRAHRRLRSRTRRWLVYPLLVVLALSSIGGGYETVRESIDAIPIPPQPARQSAMSSSGANRSGASSTLRQTVDGFDRCV